MPLRTFCWIPKASARPVHSNIATDSSQVFVTIYQDDSWSELADE